MRTIPGMTVLNPAGLCGGRTGPPGGGEDGGAGVYALRPAGDPHHFRQYLPV